MKRNVSMKRNKAVKRNALRKTKERIPGMRYESVIYRTAVLMHQKSDKTTDALVARGTDRSFYTWNTEHRTRESTCLVPGTYDSRTETPEFWPQSRTCIYQAASYLVYTLTC